MKGEIAPVRVSLYWSFRNTDMVSEVARTRLLHFVQYLRACSSRKGKECLTAVFVDTLNDVMSDNDIFTCSLHSTASQDGEDSAMIASEEANHLIPCQV